MNLIRRTFKDKKFLRTFFILAFPVMLQTTISFFVTFADNLMIAGVSNAAISAVYAANQATFLYMIAIFGVTAGAGIYIQQFFGAKDDEHIKQAFRYKMVAMIGLVIITLPLYYYLGEKLIWVYCKADVEAQLILELGKQYLHISLLSYIPYGITVVYSNSFREIGKTKVPLLTGSIALVANIVFNSILIYGFDMGVVGAAFATVIARLVEMVVVILLAHKRKEVFAYRIYHKFIIERKVIIEISKKSLPLFINELLWALGMIALSLAYAQREGVLSALSVVSTVTEIFGIVFQGLAIGTGIMVGKLLGAGKMDEAKENAKRLFVLGVAISFIAGVIMVALSPIIPLMFREITKAQRNLATYLILIYASLLWAYSICVSCYQTLRAGGKTGLTLTLEFTCMWLICVPVAWILASLTNVNIIIIYLCVQSCDMVKAIIGVYMVKKGTWVTNLTEGLSKKLKNNI